MVKQLPSAQVMIPGSWYGVPHRPPCSVGSLLIPLILFPLRLSLSQINKRNLRLLCLNGLLLEKQNKTMLSCVALLICFTSFKVEKHPIKKGQERAWVAQLIKQLPSAQVMILESWDQVRIGLPAQWGVCFSL